MNICACLTWIITHNFDLHALNGDFKKLTDITLTELQTLYPLLTDI